MWVEGWGQLPGKLIVVSGPSGSGKSTIIRRTLDASGLNVQLSVSATTRAPRPGETNLIDYEFLPVSQFHALRDERRLLEWAEYNGNCYGTPKQSVYEALAAGRSVILEIEVQGALQVRESAPSSLFVFFKTATFHDLERRLRKRGTETEAQIHERLRTARRELAEAHWYDRILLNEDLDTAVEHFTWVLKSFIEGDAS